MAHFIPFNIDLNAVKAWYRMTKREEIEYHFSDVYWPITDSNEYNYVCPMCYAVVNGYNRIMHVQWHLDLFDSINGKENEGQTKTTSS